MILQLGCGCLEVVDICISVWTCGQEMCGLVWSNMHMRSKRNNASGGVHQSLHWTRITVPAPQPSCEWPKPCHKQWPSPQPPPSASQSRSRFSKSLKTRPDTPPAPRTWWASTYQSILKRVCSLAFWISFFLLAQIGHNCCPEQQDFSGSLSITSDPNCQQD